MITNLYTVYDSIAESYGPLYHAKNNMVAMRNFKDLIKNCPDKSEFDLYFVGSFDDEKGLISKENSPVLITKGFDIVVKDNGGRYE